MKRSAVMLSLLAVALLAVSPVWAAEASSSLGRKIDGFTLKDFRGAQHSLADLDDAPVIVVAFLGTECPLAKLYGPRLEQHWQKYREQGVAFLGINSNRQDSISELATHATKHGMTFPMLKDVGNEVADQFGAERTPQIFVLDADRVIRYQGRIDDQYGFDFGAGYQKPQMTRDDLGLAVDELLAGKDVSVPLTEAKGCIIGRVRDADENSEITYSKQVARIIQNRCLECHREGQVAPFALEDYDEVAGWGEMIQEVIEEQRMPPWHANPAHGKFSNDLTLTDAEKEAVFAWVENGCPEGDPADLPEPRQFAEGWALPREPDVVINMRDEPYSVPAEGVVDYQYWVVDPGFTEDQWVKVSECMPGNPKVVHHIIVYIQQPDAALDDFASTSFLSGFAPGTRPQICPEGAAMKIPAGGKLVFELHYTPCGTVEEDMSSIGLVFADPDEVTHQMVTTNAFEGEFVIPPHASNHRVDASVTFTKPGEIISLFPHMHLRGKAFRYLLRQPDGSEEIVLDVPRYDFNWQYHYILEKPLAVDKGSQLYCIGHFDNSEENVANPNPDEEVRYGLQTWEEMMIGWYSFAMPRDNFGIFTEEEAAEAAAKESGTTEASGD